MTTTNSSTILIADDNLVTCQVFRDLLEPEGHRLLFAHDGSSAVEAAITHTPDLILLDVMMPGMNGFEVCRELRQTPLTAQIPIIMITALDERQFRIDGIQAGANDFLTKPFNAHELSLRVRNIIRLNRYRRLLNQSQQFEYLLTHAQIGYLILDEAGQIGFANLQGQRYLNQRIEEDTPPDERNFTAIVGKLFRQEPAVAWRNWPEPPPDKMVRYLIRPEDKWIKAQWLEVDVLNYEVGPTPNWLVSLRDVTEQIEEQRDIRTFQSMVAHKLRTPLVGIIGGLYLVGKEAASVDLQPLNESIAVAQKKANELHKQIEDILRYAQIPALARGADFFDLDQLPSLTAQIAQDVALETVRWASSPEELHGRISLSTQAMEIILYEILENARKFHPEQKPIVEIEVQITDSFMVLIISNDTGHLPLEHLTRVWLPYYQAEKSFTGQVPGMGLGLPTVATLVWQANGYCDMYNRRDQAGVSVEIKLPLRLADGDASPPLS